jgi:two-component sensor histidine kinase
VDVLFSGAPIVISGELTGVVAIYKDMRRLRQAERQTLRSEEKFRLLFRESQHRIKNDLALVRSLLSMQAADTADEGCREIIEEAESRITVIATVHEVLFRHSEVETVQVKEFTESLIAALRRVWEPSGLSVSVEAADIAVPARVSLSLGIILNELYTNSLKYGVDSGSPGSITTRVGLRDAGHIALVFADSGAGFPQEVLEGRRRGLGLNIIATLARQHEGELHIRNEDGAVAEVVLSLPAAEAAT